jgi:predicted RNA binding protein YcfA (HicA-like mRNA interferase family)
MTDLQQCHLKHEFTSSLEELGFVLQKNTKNHVAYQHQVHPEIYIVLSTDPNSSLNTETLHRLPWGYWELQDSNGLSIHHKCCADPGRKESCCQGFWLDGVEAIRSFLTLQTEAKHS